MAIKTQDAITVNYITEQKYALVKSDLKAVYVDYAKLVAESDYPLPYQAIIGAMKQTLPQPAYKENPASWANQFNKIDSVHPITKKTVSLSHIIINLNDEHKWTREQIADWLETTDVNPIITQKEIKNDNPF